MNGNMRKMIKRVQQFDLFCVNCNFHIGTECHGSEDKCPKCGYSCNKSCSIYLDKLFEGIDVPPDLMKLMKDEVMQRG